MTLYSPQNQPEEYDCIHNLLTESFRPERYQAEDQVEDQDEPLDSGEFPRPPIGFGDWITKKSLLWISQ